MKRIYGALSLHVALPGGSHSLLGREERTPSCRYGQFQCMAVKSTTLNLEQKKLQKTKEDHPLYPVLSLDSFYTSTTNTLSHCMESYRGAQRQPPLSSSGTKDPISSGVRVHRASVAGPIVPCLAECGPRWGRGIVASPQDVRWDEETAGI